MTESQRPQKRRWEAAIEIAGGVAFLALVMLLLGQEGIAVAAVVAALVVACVGLVGWVSERDR